VTVTQLAEELVTGLAGASRLGLKLVARQAVAVVGVSAWSTW